MRLIPIIKVIGVLAMWMLSGTSALGHPSWAIVIDRQDQIYFSDLEAVWKIDAKGNLTVFRAASSGKHVHDLNIDDAGNLYGADNSYEPETKRFFSSIWKMTPAGAFSYLLAPTDDPPEGTSIWTDREGNTYHFTNHPARELLVLKRNRNGSVTALVGSTNAVRSYRQGVPYSAGGTAFGADGSLYFTNGSNVSRLTTTGVLIPLARNLVVDNASGNPAGGTQLFGIAADGRGNAFVADYGNRRVFKIDSAGKMTTAATAEQPWSPTGVAWKDDSLYVLESGFAPPARYATRVRKVSSDGKITVLATVGDGLDTAAAENTGPELSENGTNLSFGTSHVFVAIGLGVFGAAGVTWWLRRRKVVS